MSDEQPGPERRGLDDDIFGGTWADPLDPATPLAAVDPRSQPEPEPEPEQSLPVDRTGPQQPEPTRQLQTDHVDTRRLPHLRTSVEQTAVFPAGPIPGPPGQVPPPTQQQWPSQPAQPPPYQGPGTPLGRAPMPPMPPGPGWGPPSRGNPPRRPSGVPGWLVPTVCVLALLLGAAGGYLGAVVHDRVKDARGTNSQGLAGVQTRQDVPLETDNQSIAAVARELLPSTVQILAFAKADDDAAQGTGSGFVLDAQGHVVTNNHVIAGSVEGGKLQVVDSDGRTYPAKVVGRSPVYDLAVLLLEDGDALGPAALGAAGQLQVGDPVVAFGAPLGLSQTVTSGIISALNRPVTTGRATDETSFINAVQTDAAINPGNSGGPLVNLQGQVIGVNSAIATTGGASAESGNIGVGFAIPIDQVRVTVDQILKNGEAQYPVIGANVSIGGTVTDGAAITGVEDGSPAEKAGLNKGDVVRGIEGARISDGIALIVAIRTHQPGDTITLEVRGSDGDERDVQVTLEGRVG